MKRRSLLSALALVIGLTICNSNNVKKVNNELMKKLKLLKAKEKKQIIDKPMKKSLL